VSIHKNQSNRWDVRWREGRKNRSRTFDRKRDAELFSREARRTRQMGGIVPSRTGNQTLEEFALHWWLGKRDELAPKTRHEYEAMLARHIVPYLGHLQLIDLRPLLLDEWQRDRLCSGAGPESIAKSSRLLAQILDRAVALELIGSNPARTLSRPRRQRRELVVADPHQVEAIRGWFLHRGRQGDAALVSVLAYVGTRPMEALALRWPDIEQKRISVTKALSDGEVRTTKTGRARSVEVTPTVAQELREWRIAIGRPQDLVWPRPRAGGHWRQADWNNWRRRWFDKAKLDTGATDLVPYGLRHSAASLFIAAGRPVTEVANQLGHSPEMSARTYQHLLETARGKPVRTIEEWVSEARAEMATTEASA
jgi:integrase